MPRVNLLPPEIAEQAALRRSKIAMAGVGLAAVAVVGVMYTSANAKVNEATEAKAEATAASDTLTGQLNSLKTVRDTYAKIDGAKQTLAAAMKNEILWSSYLHDLTLTIPDNVWLERFTATLNVATPGVAPAAPAANAPVLDPGLGSIAFEGVAMEHPDVANWLESLARQKGYSHAYFTNAAKNPLNNRIVVEFTSSVNLTADALSNRYTKGTTR